eukprot:8441667-Prorocentrum_lima.AAC.1
MQAGGGVEPIPAPATGQKRRPDTQGGPVPAGKGRPSSPKPPPGYTMSSTGVPMPKSPPDAAIPATRWRP